MHIVAKPEQRVVIVDDSRTIQALLETILESSGRFKVVGVASEAGTAAAMIAELKPDVVTIDLCMPYIDGADLLKMLAEQTTICKIVISDHAAGNLAMVNRLREAGAAACLAKSDVSASAPAFLKKLEEMVTSFRSANRFHHSLPSHALPPGRHAYADLGRSPAFGYPIPADEKARLEYLRRKQLANNTPERQFDLITRYFAQLSTFPVCLMTFIDKDTQWLKSAYGLPADAMPRCEAFCNYTIAQNDTFVVRNAANDPTFATFPNVTGNPNIRTYVGHPIVSEQGINVGALCVIDTNVRLVTDKLLAQLKGMAEIVGETIDRRPMLAA